MPGTIINLTELENARNLFTDEAFRAPYDFYTCESHFDFNMGIVQVPPAAPDLTDGVRTASEFVKVSCAYGRRMIYFAAQRIGDWPLVPSPDPANENEIVLGGKIVVVSPVLLPDGQAKRYRAYGVYSRGLVRPLYPEDGLAAGKVPYDLSPAATHVIPPQYFRPDLAG